MIHSTIPPATLVIFKPCLTTELSVVTKSWKNIFEKAKKNATYRSKMTQNKLIKICGKQV